MVDESRSDAVVVARMHAAAQMLRDAGLEVDGGDGVAAHLRRAVRWHRYSQGPVSDLHRSCGRDIARGSLRLWSAAGGVPDVPEAPARQPDRPGAATLRANIQLARVQLVSLVRVRCAALREDLSSQAAHLTRRGIPSFGQRVRQEALRLAAELDEAVADRLGELGLPTERPGRVDPPVAARLPAHRRPGLENQLSALVGVGFGAGVSLTVSRVVADLCPDYRPAATAVCGLLGLALTSWTVLARRLVAERAAAERWGLETVASLRLALEERVLTWMLTAEYHQAAAARSGPRAGTTPSYRHMSRPR